MEAGPRRVVSSDKMDKPRIEPAVAESIQSKNIRFMNWYN